MALTIDCVLIDCVDLEAMTGFWCEALDLEHVWTLDRTAMERADRGD